MPARGSRVIGRRFRCWLSDCQMLVPAMRRQISSPGEKTSAASNAIDGMSSMVAARWFLQPGVITPTRRPGTSRCRDDHEAAGMRLYATFEARYAVKGSWRPAREASRSICPRASSVSGSLK